MPNLEFKGAEVIKVGETETRGASNYEVRELVLKSVDNPTYPQFHVINFNGKKAPDLDKVSVGDAVDVSINVNGREWADRHTGEQKYFNSLDGWKVSVVGKVAQPPAPVDFNSPPDDDDLPF